MPRFADIELVVEQCVLLFQQLHGMSVNDWMIIDKKVSKPELTMESVTVESKASTVAEPAVKPLDFEVCFPVITAGSKCVYIVTVLCVESGKTRTLRIFFEFLIINIDTDM